MVKNRDSNEFRSALASEDDPSLRKEREVRAIFTNASRIPHGHAQLMATITAERLELRTAIQTEKELRRKENERYHITEKERQRKESERYYIQEMQRLAEWNAEVVTIAGVQMTNDEAQRARRCFIENEDEYAERAVQRGLIHDGEQDTLKHAMRRRYDLEERVGRGNASSAERRELEDIKNSRMGRATDEITAAIHKNGFENTLKTSVAKDPAVSSADTASLTARDIFQSAPVAQNAFAQAAQAIAPGNDTTPEILPEIPTPVTRSVKATGLEI